MSADEKLYSKASESEEELVSSRKSAFSKGWPTGFHCLDQVASFLKNYQTLLYSPPHVGKSVITIDILMAQAEMGKNICIYSPEYRDKGELYNALIQARIHKCFFGRLGETITDEEYKSALNFVDKHFVILVKPRRNKDNSQDKMSIKKVFSEIKKASKHYDMKFDYLFIDPVNYLEKEGEEKYMETQDYVLNLYDQVAEYSELMGVHTILSAHTRDVELQFDKETGKQFYGVLHPSTVVGGQSNFRAAYQILHLFRGPEGVINPQTGAPYPANYTKIYVQKSKPYGIGRLSDTGSIPYMDGLYFDPETYTMYEYVEGVKYYRNQYYKYLESRDSKYKNPVVSSHKEDYEQEQKQEKEEFFRKAIDPTADSAGVEKISYGNLGF